MTTNVRTQLIDDLEELLIDPPMLYSTIPGDTLTSVSTQFYSSAAYATSLGTYNVVSGDPKKPLPQSYMLVIPFGDALAQEPDVGVMYHNFPQLGSTIRIARDAVRDAHLATKPTLLLLSRVLFAATLPMGLLIRLEVISAATVTFAYLAQAAVRDCAAWIRINAPYAQGHGQVAMSPAGQAALALFEGHDPAQGDPPFDQFAAWKQLVTGLKWGAAQ